MAIDTGTSLDSGASDITYTGDEGPQDPRAMTDIEKIILQHWMQQGGSYGDDIPEEFRQQIIQIYGLDRDRSASGGIARLGYDLGGNVRQRPHQPRELLVNKTSSGERPKYQPPGRDYGGPPGRDPSPGGYSDAERHQAQRTAALQESRGPIGRPTVASTAAMEGAYALPKDLPPSMRSGALNALWTPPPEEEQEEEKLLSKVLDKGKTLASDFRKKSILRNLYHVAKGRPIQPAIMAMLQGTMTEEEFENQFGVSIEGLIGLSPMEQTNIFGKEMSQFDKDRLSEMAGVYGQDYVSQDDWTTAFYGPKGPPVSDTRGDQLPYYPPDLHPGMGGITDVDVAGTNYDDFIESLKFASAPEELQYSPLPLAYGGRVPAAYGGIMGDDGRRAYGLGSIFKKAGKKLKKFAKSKIGKIALGYLAGAGLAGIGQGQGLGRFKFGNFMKNIGRFNPFSKDKTNFLQRLTNSKKYKILENYDEENATDFAKEWLSKQVSSSGVTDGGIGQTAMKMAAFGLPLAALKYPDF